MPWACVDFALTDPPYLVNYRDHHGRSVANDDNDAWLKPAFRQIHRVPAAGQPVRQLLRLERGRYLHGRVWREAGFSIVGHIVFRKSYPCKTRFLSYRHESAYLLAKGRPALPARPVPDVLEFPYTGNRLHPTQKPVQPLKDLIAAFTHPRQIVLDPVCGSGSTLAAAQDLERRFIGIDLDATHCRTARERLGIAGASLKAAA